MTYPQSAVKVAEPFFFAGGNIGCLLVHGFSGSPAEMRLLGEHLADAGHTVQGIRLAGHGSSPEALQGVSWRDWLQSVETGFDELRQRCAEVVVVGFSLGGALSLVLARRRQFERLVVLAAPLFLEGDWRLNFLPVLRYFVPWFYPLEEIDLSDPAVQQRIHNVNPDIDLSDPQVQQQIRRSVKIPVGAIDELQHALGTARRQLASISLPTLAIYGRDDKRIPLSSADILINNLGSTQKQLVWWGDTGHQLVQIGPHRDAIFAQVAAFVTNEPITDVVR